MDFLFFLLFGAYLTLFEEIGQSLVGDKLAIAFGQLLRIGFDISACICVIVLESSQILLKVMVVAVAVGHDGAVQLIVMHFSLLFGISIEFFSLNALSLDDFFYALLPSGLILV